MTAHRIIRLSNRTIDLETGDVVSAQGRDRLEPKTLNLLKLFVSAPNRLFTHEEILTSVWPGVTVGEDTLARAISKLRKALGDDPKSPGVIETIAKRGYRLMGDPSSVDAPTTIARGRKFSRPMAAAAITATFAIGAAIAVFAGREPKALPENALVARADDFYFQYARADNEAAIELYERVIAANPDDAQALAGLANALVQRAMRWPVSPADARGDLTTLGAAISSGRLDEQQAKSLVERALSLAAEAAALTPGDARALKALGLAQSAAQRFDEALSSYDAALRADPDAWGVLINIGDVLEITGRADEALPYFERAYVAMSKAYPAEAARVRPWQARLGVGVARRREVSGDRAAAETWYRRVLALSPFDAEATQGLKALLLASGRAEEADLLCRTFMERSGPDARC